MNAQMRLHHKLLLLKWLSDGIARVRKDDALPEAQDQMVPGERVPVKFGGKLAGWVSMPKPTVTASVTDEAAVLAWLRANAPDHIATVTDAPVTAGLIEYLAEHAPQFLAERQQPDPFWAADVCAALKSQGYYVNRDGEKITEVPGITVKESDPAPRVNLERDATETIAAAWRAGEIGLDGILALPAGGEPG